MKIIIMDHNKTAKDSVCGYLTIIGHSCEHCNCDNREAACHDEALRLITTYNPDLIVTDLKMPNMNGLDLLKSIKKEFPWIKVIILTGHADVECAMEAINFGADGFFRKTLDNVKFTKKIREIEETIY